MKQKKLCTIFFQWWLSRCKLRQMLVFIPHPSLSRTASLLKTPKQRRARTKQLLPLRRIHPARNQRFLQSCFPTAQAACRPITVYPHRWQQGLGTERAGASGLLSLSPACLPTRPRRWPQAWAALTCRCDMLPCCRRRSCTSERPTDRWGESECSTTRT